MLLIDQLRIEQLDSNETSEHQLESVRASYHDLYSEFHLESTGCWSSGNRFLANTKTQLLGIWAEQLLGDTAEALRQYQTLIGYRSGWRGKEKKWNPYRNSADSNNVDKELLLANIIVGGLNQKDLVAEQAYFLSKHQEANPSVLENIWLTEMVTMGAENFHTHNTEAVLLYFVQLLGSSSYLKEVKATYDSLKTVSGVYNQAGEYWHNHFFIKQNGNCENFGTNDEPLALALLDTLLMQKLVGTEAAKVQLIKLQRQVDTYSPVTGYWYETEAQEKVDVRNTLLSLVVSATIANNQVETQKIETLNLPLITDF